MNRFRLLSLTLLALLMLGACGEHRPPQLQWPAQITEIKRTSQIEQNRIIGAIDALNVQLGSEYLELAIGQSPTTRSPIRVQKVTSFPSAQGTLSRVFDFITKPGGEYAFAPPTPGRVAQGSQIAGRATLRPGECSIELADFLFQNANDDLLDAVLFHEVGHCRGLLHRGESNELMSVVTLPLSRYSSEQLERFVRDFVAAEE